MTPHHDPQQPAIQLARPDISDREVELVLQVLHSDVLALGPFAQRFEAAVAALAGRAHGIACSSGTAGLHMAVRALGIGAGDEVITTPFSFVASANCMLYEGAVPRFVDIEEDSLGLDPDLVAAAATKDTRAVLPVHVFGRPCRIEPVESLARDRGWRIIEDACEGLGSSVDGRPLGSFGDIADVLRSLRNQGRDTDGTWLRHVRLGYNYRLDELSAALGVAQTERIEALRAGRARVVAAYERELAGADWVRLPTAGPRETVDWFVYVVRLAAGIDRNRVLVRLAERGVPARPYFSPLHLQPYFRSMFGYQEGDFPVTERIAASTLALPFSSRLPDDDVKRVADALRDAVA
jgi:perosamine synthetase